MEGLAGYILTGIVSLMVGILITRFQPKAKLVYWFPHVANFDIDADPGPPVSFQTSALTVQNLGRRAAGDVQIILSGEPADLQMYPIIPHEEYVSEDGHFVLTIPRLAPQEIVSLQIVGLGYFPSLLNLRSDAGVAQNVPVKIERIYPTWWTGPLIALLLAGLGVTIYWVIRVAGLVIGLFGE